MQLHPAYDPRAMFLSRQDFAHVVRHAPFVSIDLIVLDEAGHVLVGLRKNRPAKGTWFVPGGIVFKDERLDDAFLRISHMELGRAIPRDEASLLGVYEHHYDDNALELSGVSTHYVVVAYQLRVNSALLDVLPPEQHEHFRWMDVDAIRNDSDVHPNTKAYFS